ncbi:MULTISPECIES: hypothetical protein [unclassified Tardiphaga]|nr:MULTISPECIES: hypothetical protein [unclassified Tardiphaga]
MAGAFRVQFGRSTVGFTAGRGIQPAFPEEFMADGRADAGLAAEGFTPN